MRSFLLDAILIISIIASFGAATVGPAGYDSDGSNFINQLWTMFQDGAIPSDSSFFQQWGMTKVQAPEAWDICRGDAGVIIAILDSGVDMDHPDLQDKIVAYADFTGSDTGAEDHLGQGRVPAL